MLLTLLGLTGVAISQPLLDVFGHSPETFVFLDAGRRDIVAFALVVALVPPVGLWICGVAVGLGGERSRRAAHLGTLAVLGAVIFLQLWPRTPSAGPYLLAALGGLALAFVVHRWSVVESWTHFLAILPVASVAVFLYASPVADLQADSASASVRPAGNGGEPLPSLVVIVFDELPTSSLLDGDGTIDSSRFPNFARLAEQSNWYRNYSSLAAWTDVAMPPMLTGTLPDGRDPIYANYPDNLFTLFAPTHHLTVSEALTAFCPSTLCEGSAPAPPEVSGADERGRGRGFDQAELYRRAREAWFDQIKGGSGGDSDFDDFEEEVVRAPVELTGDPGNVDRQNALIEGYPEHQPTRLRDFVSAIGAGDGPVLYYLHLVLPHSPFRFYPDGTDYRMPAGSDGVVNDASNEWAIAVNRQRHLLQAQYVDGLLGQLMAALAEADVWRGAVVAVVADHGASFIPYVFARDIHAQGADQVLQVPLFIKAPEQTASVVDDSNLWSVDLLPTLAELVGIDVPWAIDGFPAASAGIAARGGLKQGYRFQQGFERGDTAVFSYQQADVQERMLAARPPPTPPTAGPLGPLYVGFEDASLLGTRLSDLELVDSGTAEVLSLGELTAPPAGEPPLGAVIGRVDEPSRDQTSVVLAFDDVIIGVAPLTRYEGGPGSFLVLLSPESVDLGPKRVDIAVRSSDGTMTRLELRGA